MNRSLMLHKIVSFGLACVFFLTSPLILLSQQKLMGELIISAGAGGESGPVTINGEAALSGVSVLSPLEIATPAQTSATIIIKGVGRLEFAPNSRMNLTFDKGKISGLFTQGSVTILSVRETAFAIETSDGVVSGPYPELDNIVSISFDEKKKKVGVKTISGFASFNGVLIPAGGVGGAVAATAAASSAGGSVFTSTLVTIAAAVGASLGLSKVLDAVQEDDEVVSPVR
jgi:hypothetical protein